MREDNWLGIVLVALGGFWLLRSLGVLPPVNWGLIWPVALIVLGALALSKTAREPRRREIVVDGRTVTVEEESPVMRLIAGIVVTLIIIFVLLVVFGFVAPFVILFIPLLPLILFLKLGAVFLRVLFSMALWGAPILIILLLLGLLL